MDQLTSWTHTVSLTTDPSSAARARDFVCAHLLVHGLPGLVDDVRLVVSELTTNALQHAATPFSLTLMREGHSVLVSVQDSSPRLPQVSAADTMQLRGRGLAIVDRLSAGWGVDVAADRTKAVWARFDTGRTMAPEW
jgi:anti-sigma regulatory factor (Ser/Thr protein kinase)